MADNTRLHPGYGGDLIRTEDIGGTYKIAVSKIYLGANGVDGGPIGPTNPLPVGMVGLVTVQGDVNVPGTVTVQGAVSVPGTVTVQGAVSVPGTVTVQGAVSVPGTVTVAGSVGIQGVVDVQGSTRALATTGIVHDGATALTPKHVAISAAAAGINTLVAAVPGKRIRVLQYLVVAAAPVSVEFRSGAATQLTGAMSLAANGGIGTSASPLGHFHTDVGQSLALSLSTAAAVAGHLTYIEV